jgi:putative ABC transport system permease protein
VTREPRLPRHVRWLLRLTRVPRDRRGEVQDDLLELFTVRLGDRGRLRAHWRLYRDLASLSYRRLPSALQRDPRPRAAVLRDASGDLRYAARLFARQPAILLLAILGLSLGLAVSTAAFSIMNAAVLRGEGLREPGRAPGVLKASERFTSTEWRYGEFLQLRDGATRMQVEAVLTEGASVRTEAGDGPGPTTNLGFVSGGFFAATGGRVALGRVLDRADEQQLDSPPVVVSFVFWSTRLNRDPAVIGRPIRVGRTTATIVGVAERGFSLPNLRMVWMPMSAFGAVYNSERLDGRSNASVQVFGRLQPGVSLAEAEAQLSGVASTLPVDQAASGAGDSRLRAILDTDTGLGRTAGSARLAVAVFVFVVIGLVLLLACANVASVLVSTAITREREMGVRAALGASRWRIVRQLLTESLALGAIAAAIGLMLAYWALPTVGIMVEAPAAADIAPDVTVFAFLGLVTLLTGVGAGLAPAWHGRGADLVTPLKGEGAGRRLVAPRRLRSTLITMQAAVSVLLIVMATLFVRASVRAATIDVGFDSERLYAVSATLSGTGNDNGAGIRAFWARAIAELQSVPGVTAVALTELTPFGDVTKTSIAGDGRNRVVVHLNRTRAEYFETMGLRLMSGRIYTRDEVAAKAPVAVVSESLARAYWHGESPLGDALPEPIKLPALPAAAVRPVIVGVVADAIPARLNDHSAFAVYEPLDPSSEIFARLMIRVAPGTSGVIDDAVQRLRSIDARADVRVASVAAQLEQETSRPRMLATLTVVVGAIAVVLCVIGLYGLTASVVGQRTREMGVRVAMGAAPGDLLRLMMWDGLRPVAIGLAIGIGAALLASRVAVSSLLFGVSPQDPLAFGGAAAILLTSATLAVLVPTRRAAAVDAAGVLRQS